jgi:hypothetical protein
MKISYWVIVKKDYSRVEHFSITGEGSVEEECYQDAFNKAKSRPGVRGNIEMQKFSEI